MSQDAAAPQREFLGHPVGLYVLFFTEMWERFSYYGMRAILMLYMVQYLAWSDGKAGGLYGDYTGLVYITPLFGGFLADRYLGLRRAIVIGAFTMALGQGFLAFNAYPTTAGGVAAGGGLGVATLYLGLLLLIAGNGFFKPNISTLVGQLYGPEDPRRDAAFTIFYMGINIGAFLAPLICGTLAQHESFGWHWGFGAACVGMVLGGVIFLWGARFLGEKGIKPVPGDHHAGGAVLEPISTKEKARLAVVGVIGAAVALAFALYTFNETGSIVDAVRAVIWPATVFIVIGMYLFMHGRCTKEEMAKVSVIFVLGIFVMIFWAAYEQAGSSLTLFADRSTRLEIFGFPFVASNFQALPALLVILFAPIFSAVWTWLSLKGKDPSTPVKMALGLLFNGAGFLMMVQAALLAADGGRVSPLWLSACYLLQVMGELCLSPIGLSMVTRLAPARYGAMLMGVWFLANAFAGKLAGFAGSLYGTLETTTLFAGTAAILLVFGGLLVVAVPWLKRKMA